MHMLLASLCLSWALLHEKYILQQQANGAVAIEQLKTSPIPTSQLLEEVYMHLLNY